ncbi:unnamed protein product [Amoebophrya sp. A120]|nr:unnamed protein product [Amoebophrya sp. A120]|eukprot:GSA120T00010771001.1
MELSGGHSAASVHIGTRAASSSTSTADRYVEFPSFPQDPLRIKNEVDGTSQGDEAWSSTGGNASQNPSFSSCFPRSFVQTQSATLANLNRTAGVARGVENAGGSTACNNLVDDGAAAAVSENALPLKHTSNSILQEMANEAGLDEVSSATLACSSSTKRSASNVSCTSLICSSTEKQFYVKMELARARDLFSIPESVLGYSLTVEASGTRFTHNSAESSKATKRLNPPPPFPRRREAKKR